MSAASRELGGEGNSCTRCLQAQATHHICQIIDGNKEIQNLCDPCAEKWYARTNTGIPDLRNAKCFYCGAGAISGSLNQPWERQVRGQEFHFACSTCLENYSRRFIERLKGLSTDDSVVGQIQQMARMVQEVDSEVRAIATRSKN
jgi:protein-arginine kinase activator protein McsA